MDAQSDLHLCCSHMAKTGFLMTWLICQIEAFRNLAFAKNTRHKTTFWFASFKVNVFVRPAKKNILLAGAIVANVKLFFLSCKEIPDYLEINK